MNWYKKAQSEERPYSVYRVGGGQPVIKLRIPVIFAFSPEQARMFAIKKYPAIKGFVESCLRHNRDCDIQVRLDEEKWEEIQKYKEVKNRLQKDKEENAWYNRI